MLNVALPQRIRAGCDADPLIRQYGLTLCLSAFARVATTKNRKQIYSQFFATAHSRGLRRDAFKRAGFNWALPQRIRAGCDRLSSSTSMRVTIFATAHSRGLRQWQNRRSTCRRRFATVHSRGLRLIVRDGSLSDWLFATAHSCGLRPLCVGAKSLSMFFATAHSCGLRP